MTKDYEGILNLKSIYKNVSSTNQFNTPSACFSRREISRTDFDKKQVLMWYSDSKNVDRGIGFTCSHFHRNWAIDDFRKMVRNQFK